MKKITSLFAAALSTLLLAGCSFSVGTGPGSVSKDRLASQARDIIKEQSPDLQGDINLDCGSGDVKLEDGATLDCDLTGDQISGAYAATLTISEVDGSDYKLSYQINEN
jgi:outer membrane murein-binding lipoprotein Lpp